MHRRRYHLERFLPHDNHEESLNMFYPKLEEPQFENEEEEPYENPFTDVQEQLHSSSFEESLHLNDLFVEPKYQENLFSLFIYQPLPPGTPPRMAQPQPTFPFPIPPQQGNQNLKNIPIATLPKFYGLIT